MPAENLQRKKAVRGGHRAAVTKAIGRAEELLASEDPNEDRLLQLKLTLSEKLEVLKSLDAEILDMIKEEDIADEIAQADGYKDELYAVLVKVECALKKMPTVVAETNPTTASGPLPVSCTRTGSHVKLPKLNIQPFKGDLTTWTPFWESYCAAVHDNTSLTDTEKFNYLRSLLEHTALDAISGLSLTAPNYREAISVLEKRFGNKQRIVAKHMDALMTLEAVSSSHNLKALRRLHDQIESHTRSLKSLGVGSNSYGALLASVILNKLPQELQLLVSRKVGNDGWELDQMMKIIEEEIQARERTVAVTNTPAKRPTRDAPTTASLLTRSSSSSNISCSYCQQPHSSNSCQTVTHPTARKQILQKAGRCFLCLRRGHLSRDCHSPTKCRKCGGKHHISICFKSADTPGSAGPGTSAGGTPSEPILSTAPSQQNRPSSGTAPCPTEPPATPRSTLNAGAPTFNSQDSRRTTSMLVSSNRPVLLQTAQALAFNPENPQKSRQVRIILDCGSQRSYITEQASRELSLLPEGEQRLTIMTFGSNEQHARSCELIRLGIVLKDGRTQSLLLLSVPRICEPLTIQPISFCQKNFKHLQGLDLADSSDGASCLNVDILIGSDLYWEMVTGETLRGTPGPIAINTVLGWVLSGPVESANPGTPSTTLVTHTLRVDGLSQDCQVLDDRLKSFWELESFGISGSDRSVYDGFSNSVRFVKGRYEVELPWKEAHPMLPDNYQLCLRRLKGLLKRLKHDPEILKEYNSIIQDQLQQGIVEVVEPSDDVIEKTHYLPHHAVVRRNKETTKVRVVYDASAHSDGPSLNECLHTGPKFNQRIFDILLRFRVHRVAITADVEKAFLMVSMAEKDRDALRFLWVESILADQPKFVELRFARVVFGVSPSPFLLNATIRHHLEQYHDTQPSLVRKLCRSFYVDDLVTGAEDEEKAHQVFVKSKEILKEGGFNLRKFCSSSATLQMKVETTEQPQHRPIPAMESEETYSSSTLGIGQEMRSGEQKVLGVRWNVCTDKIVVSLEEIAAIAQEFEPTKRNIVALAGRIYDPLGVLSPVVVRLKMLFQELCGAKCGWDQPLPDTLLKKWKNLKSSLNERQSIQISRCYFEGISGEILSCTPCGFCDASLKAYAGVVYLLIETTAGFSVKFVAAKTRVSPLKEQTIPRLELLSALLLARLVTSIVQSLESELQLSPPRYYSDSTVALCWIKGTDKTWKPFVQNRVDEIRRLTPPTSWKHCAGQDNPADIPSRGLDPCELADSVLWREGPRWLCSGDSGGDSELQLTSDCLAEIRVKDRSTTHGLLTVEDSTGLGQIMNCKEFSSLDRLLYTTSLVLKFGTLLLDKLRSTTGTGRTFRNLTAEELWIRECQRVVITDKNFRQWQRQLDLFQDERGIWRCKGRIQNASVPYSTKHPILLHKAHHFTKLQIRKAHERVLHNGVREILAELRSKFWIVRGRSLVKGIIRQCRICRRHEGRPYSAPPPPPLPPFRVEEAPPFSFTGVDFAGPIYVRSDSDNTSKKVWICLYTCCVVRAIHLDVVPDLSTPAFIRSFRRFVARRGVPQQVLSDNGKTFKAAAKSLKEVKWKFNIPKAPWWGGVFERMIGCTKRCLRKIVGQAKFSQDELLTALTEVEMVINSRPLSYLAADDLEEPLTPSHLIVGRRLMNAPNHLDLYPDEFDPSPNALTRRARHLNSTIDRFWERWRKEYLVELREAHKQRGKRSSNPRVHEGDIVIIHSDEQPRGLWSMGKVKKLLIGNDGEARGAVLKVAGQGRRTTLLRRPVQKLYPLEMSSQDKPSENDSANRDHVGEGYQDDSLDDNDLEEEPAERTVQDVPPGKEGAQGSPPLRRSTRAAASEARDRLLACALCDNDSSLLTITGQRGEDV